MSLYLDALATSVCGGGITVELGRADTVTIIGSDLDVASVTPSCSPGVSDDPVVLAVGVSIADHGDGVVDRGWARGVVQDTGLVTGEDIVTSSESNSEDTLVESSFVLGHRSLLDLSHGFDCDDTTGSLVGVAGLGLSSVWVLGLSDLRGGLEVVEGSSVPSTTAATWDAVNELLLRKVEELSRCNPVSVLSDSSGTESPTGTATTLILDGVDTALGSPVNCTQQVGVVEVANLDLMVLEVVSQACIHLHFLLGDSGEFVVAKGVRALDLVPEIELGILLLKDLESEVVLLLSSVAESKLVDVSLELLLESKRLLLRFKVALEAKHRGCLNKLHHFFRYFYLL